MKKGLPIIIGIIIAVIIVTLAIFSIRGKDLSLSKEESQENTTSRSEILNQAAQQETKGNLPEAISLYKKLVNDFLNSPQVGDWQRKVWDLNIRLLFSPMVTEESIIYKVTSGDSLAKIAKKFNTTVELLKRSNGLLSDKIITGKRLKVWIQPFNIVIDKSQNVLLLKTDDEIIKTYIVSTGMNNSTPIGNFKIVNKLVNPTWFREGTAIPPESPDNILGTRWMGFDLDDYGIHGTTEDETIGQQITRGCIRMSNSDVEELFVIVPTGTEVTIVD